MGLSGFAEIPHWHPQHAEAFALFLAEVFVVDLGVSEYANFLPGMVGNDRSRVINFYNLGIDESSRMLLDQICQGEHRLYECAAV